MLDAWPADARALAAAAVLAALPGLVLVRAPLRSSAAISVAFWVVTWTWLAGGTRSRLLHVLLPALGALAVLRLLRAPPRPRAGRPALVLAVGVAALGTVLALRAVPPGPDMAREGMTTALLAWHDGWPVSYEPLVPQGPLRASGLALLAADVALVSGAAPHRALLAGSLLAGLVLVLALWSLATLRPTSGPAAAAVVAVATLATGGRGWGPPALAVALATQAAALWYSRRGHPSAFAAGACVAAALAADVASALAGLVLSLGFGHLLARDAGPPAPLRRGRVRTAVLTAAVLALPLALRPPPIATLDPAPLIAILFVGALCAGPAVRAPLRLAAAFGAAVVMGALTRVPGADDLDEGAVGAMEWVRDHTPPLDVVCAPDVPAARWIPAIAARPTVVPIAPRWPAPSAPCRVWLSLSGAPGPAPPATAVPSFRAGTASAWTTSQTR